MSFNFSSLASTQQPSSISYLKPYTINEGVTIKSSEIKEGTASTGKPWKRLSIVFGNDEGIYEDSIFWITEEKDFQRGESTMSNGGVRQTPSNWERTSHKMAAIGYAFFPEDFEKFKNAAAKAKSFDDIANTFKKLVDKAIGKNATGMKLVARNSNGRVFAAMPNCTGIAQATEKTAATNNVNVGDWYVWMMSPFGNNLSFSAYEEQQRNALNSAKPSEMPKQADEDDEGIDINDLFL